MPRFRNLSPGGGAFDPDDHYSEFDDLHSLDDFDNHDALSLEPHHQGQASSSSVATGAGGGQSVGEMLHSESTSFSFSMM